MVYNEETNVKEVINMKNALLWLKDSFEWFLIILCWPVFLIGGFIWARKILKNHPIDEIERYKYDLRKTPITKWDEVARKHFGDEA